MTNKFMITSVIAILVIGLSVLGLEVKNLRAEVAQLSSTPASAVQAQQPSVKAKFTQPNDWRLPSRSRWDPYSELTQIQQQMDQLFNQSFRGGLWPQRGPVDDLFSLNSDIKDNQDRYVVDMDIPGMEKENINVEVKNENDVKDIQSLIEIKLSIK